jgi:hypothetical protein
MLPTTRRHPLQANSRLHVPTAVGLPATLLVLAALGWPAFSASGAWLTAPPGLMPCGVLDPLRVQADSGHAYVAPYFAVGGDEDSARAKSNVQLLEDAAPLGPPHSLHADIRMVGNGRYDHWQHALYFSASDNSDPRSNGRTYSWGVPPGGICPAQMCGELDLTQVAPDSGYGYALKENLGFAGDDSLHPARSSLLLFEDQRPLGGPHSKLEDIRQVGRGRFRHWGNTLHFASLDNSDPRTNGHKYYFGGLCRRLAPVRLVKLAANAPFYATFSSYNQHIFDAPSGVFIVYVATSHFGPHWAEGSPLDTRSDWVLARTTDRGASAQAVLMHRGIPTHVPPVIDGDTAGNVYIFEPHFASLHGSSTAIWRLDARGGFRLDSVRTIDSIGSDKFSTVYDPSRNLFFYSATSYDPGHPARLAAIPPAGPVRLSPPLVREGASGFLMYPLLRVDERDDLYLAWTSQAVPAIRAYLYWDIHFMISGDGATEWHRADGTRLVLPVVADEGGQADRVTLPDETGTHPWLSSFLPKNHMVHFTYRTAERVDRKHARRLNLTTGRYDVDHTPVFRGQTLLAGGQSGILLSRPGQAGGMLYFMGEDVTQRRLIVLASDDAGETWFDYAATEPRFNLLFSVSGARDIGPSGTLYGIATDLRSRDKSQNQNDIWLLSVPAE